MDFCTNYIKSINKSLVTTLPFSHDDAIKQNSVCYHGDNNDNDILCKDMPDGMTVTQVAHWYLSPERHIIEYIVVTILCSIIIKVILSNLTTYPESNNEKNKNKNSSLSLSLRPPLFLRILTMACCTLNLLYKYFGYDGKLYFLTMPCHTNWAMAIILCFYPNLSSHASNIICQIWIGMAGLTIVAIAEPDLSDLTLPFEVPYFFIHHFVLLLYPFYYLVFGKITLLPLPLPLPLPQQESTLSCFMKWWMLTSTIFSLFYVTIVTPLCMYSGLNLNYMMSPPPTPGNFINGSNYRLQSAACVFIVFWIMRFIATCVEFCIRYWNSCPFEFHPISVGKEKEKEKKIA